LDLTTHRLEIIDLSCARGDRTLFEGLRLQVGGGELLHIAGSNGSGKTTLLRTVCGLSRPATGEIRWQGQSVRTLGDEYRRHLAYVGHHDGVQGELTLAENLRAYLCLSSDSASSRDVVQHALERLGLSPYRSFPAKMLSQGQKRRLALARLLVTDKPIWILDEPLTALDLPSCRLVSELLAQHLTRGGMVVMSSHQDFEIPGITRNRIDLDSLRTDGPYPMSETYSARQASAGQRPA
jgi:heme exporter protein A